MTANVLEHRRAKAFAEALEAHQAESSTRGSHGSGSAAMAELLAMADSLGALPEPELSLEARTVQRAQLMAAFEQEWAGGRAATVPRQRRHRAGGITPRRRWSRRLAIGGLIAGVAVGSFAGAAAASTNALPGDALYGMKRGLEGLKLDWAGSDSERGALLLEQATARLDEAQGLLKRSGSPDALSPDMVEQVRRALDDMHAEAVRGRDLLRSVYRSNGSLAPMRSLANFADEDNGRWNAVQGRLPSQLTTQASKVDQLFDDISEDVAPFHLEKPAPGNAPGAAGAGGGQQSPGAASSGQAPDGSRQDPADAPNAHGTSGNSGSAHGGNSGPGNAPGSVGSLVSGLTNGLTGGGTTPAPGGPNASTAPSAPTSTTPDQGISIPPLIPGLLPGITLN